MEYTNKKIETLKKSLEYRKKMAEENPEISYYALSISVVEWDLKNAVKAEAKRKTRKAIRHIEKKMAEIKVLREEMKFVLLKNDSPLQEYEQWEFSKELEKNPDFHKILGLR